MSHLPEKVGGFPIQNTDWRPVARDKPRTPFESVIRPVFSMVASAFHRFRTPRMLFRGKVLLSLSWSNGVVSLVLVRPTWQLLSEDANYLLRMLMLCSTETVLCILRIAEQNGALRRNTGPKPSFN
ncbi:MAG: hypothetical protein AAFZ15_25745 [Bacteroidota bacterium]